jgi:integrase
MRGHKVFRWGAWRLTVEGPRGPGGKRNQITRTVRAPDTKAGAKEADAELAKLIVEIESGRIGTSTRWTVGMLMERWVEHRRSAWEERSPGQPDATLARIRRHVTPHIGDVLLTKLRPVDIDTLYARWRKDGWTTPTGKQRPMSEATVRRLHDILHSALAQAVRWDMIATNPADRVEKPRPGKRRPRDPGDATCRALLAAASTAMIAYLRIAATTGARRGQLVGLKWSDVNLEDGTILFTRALAKVKGGVAEKGTKTDNDYPVALDLRTVEIVKAHRVRCVERALAAGCQVRPDGYVFAQDRTPDGSAPWHPDGANQRFERIRAKVPGAEKVTPHQFRHWMATAMFQDGYDPVTIAGRGGWSSPAVPLSVYGHFRPASDQKAAESLAKRLDQG